MCKIFHKKEANASFSFQKFLSLFAFFLKLLFQKFLSGRFSSTKMPLGFVFPQNAPYLIVQATIQVFQSLGNVFVDSGFRDLKEFSRFPYCALIFDHIPSYYNASFSPTAFHLWNLPLLIIWSCQIILIISRFYCSFNCF